ncbi:MAG: SPOR domain-containing protein [Cytophagaceae bacterium]|nr:SPOR domain-containing protein [Cytophagaceae bacterium]MDW8456482.1 SPOR domain-containing protein [Cytophagaceae bacterium]
MEIESYIKDLLHEHDCVIIPDFGGFLSERMSVEIHPITHRFSPPSKRIAFNAQLINNDGLLASYLSAKHNISFEEALAEIKKFVLHVHQEIANNGSFVFPEVGKLFRNKENKLEFVPDINVNYLDDSFGLSELFFKPIERNNIGMTNPKNIRPVVKRQVPVKNMQTASTPKTQNSSDSSQNEKSTKSAVARFFLILIPLLILVGVGFLIVTSKQDGKSLAGFDFWNTTKEENKKPEIKREQPDSAVALDQQINNTDSSSYVPPVDESTTTIENTATSNTSEDPESLVLSESNDIPAKLSLIEKQKKLEQQAKGSKKSAFNKTEKMQIHGRYFVIVGSFIDEKNAYNFRNEIAKKGKNATVIEPNSKSRFYKVAIDDYDNAEDAEKRKNELSGKYKDVWVMMY